MYQLEDISRSCMWILVWIHFLIIFRYFSNLQFQNLEEIFPLFSLHNILHLHPYNLIRWNGTIDFALKVHSDVFLIHFLKFMKTDKFLWKKKQVLAQLFNFNLMLHDYLLNEELLQHLQMYFSAQLIEARIVHYETQEMGLAMEGLVFFL